jgi:type II secretory pathway component HofQ
LFRSTSVISNKSELLIFVTPKILKEGSTIY